MDALVFLAKPPAKLGVLYVLHGDEPFLKRQVLKVLREKALGPEPDAGGQSVYSGDTAQFAEVFDELQTVPFFSPRRLVVVEDADEFVTDHRPALEKKVHELPATGVLVLDVKSWPANTRLAKMVNDAATLECKARKAYLLPAWCATWAQRQYQKQLSTPAAELLVELTGPEMGLLDQELGKLAVYVGDRTKIEPTDVDCLVGNQREANTWKIFDAVAQGRPGEALAILDRLFERGEEPFRLMGAFNMQLRRLAQAAHLATMQGKSLGAALAQAGVPPYGVAGAEAQLRQLTRHRAARLYDWLLEMNLGLRGGSPLSERAQFERFVIRLAQPAQ